MAVGGRDFRLAPRRRVRRVVVHLHAFVQPVDDGTGFNLGERVVFGQRRGVWNHVADARQVLGGYADVEVRAQRLGHFVPEEGAEALAGNASHHFPDEEALRRGVVAALRADVPPRFLGGEVLHA